MNWYSIFYWIAVADGIKEFFDTFSNLFTFLWFVVAVALILFTLYRNSETKEGDDERESANFWIKNLRKMFVWTMFFSTITWAGWVFCPTKKDALIIVAGGAVGQFMMSDSAAQAIPSEVMVLLRDKIRAEIKDVNFSEQVTDPLQSKTKEELIKMLREK